MADETRPYDDRIILGIRAAAGNKIKMIAPTVMLKTRHLMFVEPLEAESRLLEVLWLMIGSVESQISRCHVTPAFGRILRVNTQQWPEVEWGLPDGLLQDSLGKLIPERERTCPRG
jgi:hypothetical protein